MSRTYRKRCITEKQSLIEYVNKHTSRARGRRIYEYYMTVSGLKAYKKAIEDWENEYGNWLYRLPRIGQLPPKEPTEYEFKNLRTEYIDPVHDKEVDYATNEYKKYNLHTYKDKYLL